MNGSRRTLDTINLDDDPEDALEVLGTYDLEPLAIDMISRFGGENAETAFLERVFAFDTDCNLVWQTQLVDHPDYPLNERELNALRFGLLTLIADPDRWHFDERFFSPESAFGRWQHATRTLLRLDELVRPERPWLYGWAMFGVMLCALVRAPRLELTNTRLARAMCGRSEGAEFGEVCADELPRSLEDLLALGGIGESTALQIQRRLIEMLLDPARYAPTMEEMFDPSFEP